MHPNLKRLSMGILFLLISLCVARVGTADRAADSTQSFTPSDHATPGELHQLLRARYDIAIRLLETEEKRFNKGVTTLINVYEAARRVRDSAIELPGDAADKLAALTQYLAVTRRLEDSMQRAVERGVSPSSDLELARYLRLDAEISLLRARSQGPGAR